MLLQNFHCIYLATHSANFLMYKNKRTTIVNKTVVIETPRACVNYCLATNGCIATNFLATGTQQCELIMDFEINQVWDESSDLYVAGM